MQNFKSFFTDIKSYIKQKKVMRYFLELLVVTFGVYIGFLANSRAEFKKESVYINTVIGEMYEGLKADVFDANINLVGHKNGILAVEYFRNMIEGNEVPKDSFNYFFHQLVRSYVSIQNTAPFETIKSRGLDLISNKELRSDIVFLYDFQYDILVKVEEQYPESRLFETYFMEIVRIIDKSVAINEQSRVSYLKSPLDITSEERNRLYLLLDRIESTRKFNIKIYEDAIHKMTDLKNAIELEYDFIKE